MRTQRSKRLIGNWSPYQGDSWRRYTSVISIPRPVRSKSSGFCHLSVYFVNSTVNNWDVSIVQNRDVKIIEQK